MENRKGFTLIELLAVIGIIGILMIFAVPKILKMFSNNKKETFITEVKIIYKAAESEILMNYIGDELPDAFNSVDEKLDVKSKLKYKVTISNKKISSICVTNSDYSINISDITSLKDIKSSEIEDGDLCGSVQKPVLANSSCFSFTAGAIKDYYYYEGNNSANPACPRSLIIPSTIGGVNVTTIDTGAFYNNQLTAVVIPNTVTTINATAFYNNELTSVVIPNSVTTIKTNAFRLNNLTSVEIPGSVTTLNGYVFWGNKLKSITIPAGITVIGDYTFYDNELSEVEMLGNVTSIGYYAFMKNKLTHFDIPSSVVTINAGAFNNNLFPDSEAFIYARTDTNSDGIAEINTSKLVSYAGSTKTNVIIPSSVTTIGEKAFTANGLKDISIPNTVTTIENMAFYDNDISQLTLPLSVVSFGLGVFNDNLLPDDSAFIYTRSDTNSDGIAEIDTTSLATYGGARKQNVTIPNGVVNINQASMTDCHLESVVIPTSVLNIADFGIANNSLNSVCIKGKSSSAEFSYYGIAPWGWASGYSDSNIIWNCNN